MATKTHQQSNLSKSNKELAKKRREQTKLELSIIHHRQRHHRKVRETKLCKLETEQVVTFDVVQAGSMQLDLDLKNKRGAAGLSSLLAARTADNSSTRTEREKGREREGGQVVGCEKHIVWLCFLWPAAAG